MLNTTKIRRVVKAQYGLSAPTILLPSIYGSMAQYTPETGLTTRDPYQDFKDGFNRWSFTNNPYLLKDGVARGLLSNTLGMGLDMASNYLLGSMESPLDNVYRGFNTAGNIIGSIPGLAIKGASTIVLGIDNLLGKRSNPFDADDQLLADVGGSYNGTTNFIKLAEQNAGKKYGLFGGGKRRQANRNSAKAIGFQETLRNIRGIVLDLRARVNSNIPQIAYLQELNGQPFLAYLSKNGGLLKRIKDILKADYSPNLDFEPELEFSVTQNFEPEIEFYKEGGKTEESENKEEISLKNVIPEGALHARKHNMENDDNITKKGIPVIDNDGEQQAEIEVNEIIFNLTVTKKLEELYKEFYLEDISNSRKDELAIEAGKLLTHEILHNTEDRTGLIKECKEGGTLNVVG